MELVQKIWQEKYRPSTLKEVILSEENRNLIENSLKEKSIPSFIFYSLKPGTGKTSTARAIINELGCDSLILNASDERGISVIREKVTFFSSSVSSANMQRCIFLDEGEQITSDGLKSLKFLLEEYSDNCFFIISTNDISKLIEPIRSRCIAVNFDKPPIDQIIHRLNWICIKEELEKLVLEDDSTLDKIVSYFYPDIRSMIKTLQEIKISGKKVIVEECEMEKMLKAIKNKDIDYIYKEVYGGQFNCSVFNKWMFKHVLDNKEKYGITKCIKIIEKLADTEKALNQGVNREIIFMANILVISNFI